MNKEYVVDYDCGAGEVVFEIDVDKFKEVAQQTLDFFVWSYDKDECPTIEAVKNMLKHACVLLWLKTQTRFHILWLSLRKRAIVE